MDVPAPASPCIGACSIDAATGWCVGCARTREEIAAWPSASDERKRAILAGLPARRATRAVARENRAG